MLSGMTDDRTTLEGELCQKFFNLSGKELNDFKKEVPITEALDTIRTQQIQAILDDCMQRNARFFDEESDKLDTWADDMKISLEKEIKDFDAEIKLKKAEARKVIDLQQKVGIQREVKELEKLRNERRKHLFEAQDSIDERKDALLNQIEQRLNQKKETKELFTIKWTLT